MIQTRPILIILYASVRLYASDSQMCSQHQKSIDILDNARETASTENNYNSQATRQAIVSRCEEAFGGNKPYDWPVDITEALLLGLDCVAIAGTGAQDFFVPADCPKEDRKVDM